ncbi:MAG: ParB N-terminal domain-containing protein [Acidaminococcaceae bacterium]|nr:ParB N-terminal domain-containing protein [Acidaminococcaceae bacterium]
MSELVYLPVEQLWPHPDNPRKIVDDLEELTASIKEKGILQNLTVVHVPEHTMDE